MAVEKLLTVGLSYREAAVDVRERLAIGQAELPQALEAARRSLSGVVILSTCSRTELYALAPDAAAGIAAGRQFLTARGGLDLQTEGTGCYELVGASAAQHLFRVACGLDSMVVGEPQILGQVKRAYQAATAAGTASPALARLFRQAIEVGKRARTETGISRTNVSLSSVAAELAAAELGRTGGHTLIVGAGETGKLAALALEASRAGQVTIVNRRSDTAHGLAERIGATARDFAELPEAMLDADVAITCTSATRPIVTVGMVSATMARRPARPLAIIDMALPRNVEPAVAKLPGVRLHNIDQLEDFAQQRRAERSEHVPAVEAIVDEEVDRFLGWWRSMDVQAVVASLATQAETIRRSEIERALPKLRGLDSRQQEAIDALTGAIVHKLLHGPIAALKGPILESVT